MKDSLEPDKKGVRRVVRRKVTGTGLEGEGITGKGWIRRRMGRTEEGHRSDGERGVPRAVGKRVRHPSLYRLGCRYDDSRRLYDAVEFIQYPPTAVSNPQHSSSSTPLIALHRTPSVSKKDRYRCQNS